MVKERFYKTEVVPRCLTFKRPAGTSRGVYTTRKLWEVRTPQGRRTLGFLASVNVPPCRISVAIMEWITRSRYPRLASIWNRRGMLTPNLCAITHPSFSDWKWPCVIMNRVVGGITTRPSQRGQAGIPINGLIWMGDYKYNAGTGRGKDEGGLSLRQAEDRRYRISTGNSLY